MILKDYISKSFTVEYAYSHFSILNYLYLHNDLSKKFIKKLINNNCCRINGKIQNMANRKIYESDLIECIFYEKEKFNNLIKTMEKKILYEDEWILAIDKPSLITCDQKSIFSFFKNKKYFFLHQSDKATSGVVLIGKDNLIKEKMFLLFKERKIIKHYLAIVDGIVKESKGKIESNLQIVKKNLFQTIWQSTNNKGLHAVTYWEKLKNIKEYSFILCKPITGRMHQLRVHLKESLFPILGDYLYNKSFKSKTHFSRMFLHSSYIEFNHPILNEVVSIKADMPQEFNDLLI